jgi:type II secretory pathway pseudopilin PulG
MIVVVIIGLLLTMGIPAIKKVRENTMKTTINNDAKVVAGAAQQYMMDTGSTSVTVSVDKTGAISGPLAPYVKMISPNYTEISSPLTPTTAFSFRHPLYNDNNPIYYDISGRWLDMDALNAL